MEPSLYVTMPFADMVGELRAQSDAVEAYVARELARLDPADDPDARDVTALEEVSWDVLGMEYTTGAALHLSSPQRLLRLAPQHVAARHVHYDPVSWRLGYMVAPDEVVRMAHFTFECLRLRFEADAPAALGDAINDHRLENISRMKDRAGEQWLRQRPTDASLYYAVSVREENIVGAVRDAASPTTQLTARRRGSSSPTRIADGREGLRGTRPRKPQGRRGPRLFGRR